MKKYTKYLILLVCLVLVQGCGNNSKTEENTTEIATIDPTPPDELELPGVANDFTYQFAENEDDELTDVEKLLCIDIDKRKEMIESLGSDIYWTGVNVDAMMWQSQVCSSTKKAEEYYLDYDEKYTVETVEIKSTLDGHMIPADYIYTDGNKNNDTIILVHGANECRKNYTAIANEFLERGLNVLAYDQRSAGDNTARLCSYGQFEQYDLQQYIDYVDDIVDDSHKIYLYARSQAGCTAGRVLGSDNGNEKLDGAILDCPLSSMKNIIVEKMAMYGLGEKANEYIEDGNKVMDCLYGFDVDDCEIPQYIESTTVPTLVLTSECDNIVVKSMPISLYDAIKNDKKYLYVSEVATHCNLHSADAENYDKLIDGFLSGELFNK